MIFTYMAFNKEFLINEQITAEKVLLITEDGVKHENLPIDEALKMAEERDLDLALVSPNPKMPVCKLMDYSKFKYEQTKKGAFTCAPFCFRPLAKLRKNGAPIRT